MSFSNLFSKLEQAAVALVGVKAPTLAALTGQSSATKLTPCVICYAENSGEEDPPESGTYWVNLQVEVVYAAPTDADGIDQKPLNDVMVQTVMDIFQSTTLAADLRGVAIPDFTAMGIRNRNMGFHPNEDMWVNVWTAQVLCCPSTLAA